MAPDSEKSEKHNLPELIPLKGKKFSKKQIKGKILIVSYFQTWCSDCVKEQPELLNLQKRFGDSIMIMMISDEDSIKIKKFISKFNSDLDFYQTPKALKKEWGVLNFPTTYLLNQKREVVLKKIEYIHWYTPEIIQTISMLIRGETPIH